MTDPRPSPPLPRPAPAPDRGPLDDAFYDLVEGRVRRMIAADPILATHIGIHEADDSLGDGGREALLAELDADRAHLALVEAMDPGGLSAAVRIERELELHNLRAAILAVDAVRLWERRSLAIDTIGDGLFLSFVRQYAPLGDRLATIAGRLAAVPDYLEQAGTRATVPQVRVWQALEIEAAAEMPAFIDEILAAADLPDAATATFGPAERRRLERSARAAKVAIELYATNLGDRLPDGTNDWPVGRELHDTIVAHRAFDGLDAAAILELGWEHLATEKAARVAVAREIDPDATEAEVVARIKDVQPADFAAAIDAYRDTMDRARAFLIERDLVTVPDDERVDVVETPEYLRRVIPFAAYFSPPPLDRSPQGIYVVTPAVGHDPNAMREHNLASISNTSIHEAYPGHHLQLDVARRHPSLTRLFTDAPEFVEGWGMYSELLMREHGFDDDPAFRLMVHTDAIWRACRMILDVRMHRGELSIGEATDFLVEHTGFERANAAAEVGWYTYRPTYPLSYLLGRTLLLGLREDEQRRLGDAFSLRDFHDTLLRNGSLPISFHRRLLTGDGGGR
ncbi:MAG: DUF885 domain-containing protein [Candidatus Limnocylindria bacterium]